MEPQHAKSQTIKVLIFGTFDLLHAGHENMIAQARELGTEIIAVIARDETVKKIKGQYPCFEEGVRMKNLKNRGLADRVVLGNVHDKYEIIRKIKPDTIALGYDQFAFTYGLEKFLINEKINARIYRLKAYKPQIYKSSLIRAVLADRERGLEEELLLLTSA